MQGSKVLVVTLIIIIALVAGGGVGFFFGQRNPTFNSLPQLIPHISNRTLAELARTSAEIRNVEINAQMDGSVLSLSSSIITVAKGNNNGIQVVTTNKTTFVDASQASEIPITFSDIKVGDNLSILINVANDTVTAIKVIRR